MTDLDKARESRSHGRKASRTNDRSLSAEEVKARLDARNRPRLEQARLDRVAAQVRTGEVESTWAYRKGDSSLWCSGFESEEAALSAAKADVSDAYWGPEVPDEIVVAELFPVVTRRLRCTASVGVEFEEVGE